MVDFECHGDLDLIINSVLPLPQRYHPINFDAHRVSSLHTNGIYGKEHCLNGTVKCLAITDYTQIAIKYIYYEKKI